MELIYHLDPSRHDREWHIFFQFIQFIKNKLHFPPPMNSWKEEGKMETPVICLGLGLDHEGANK